MARPSTSPWAPTRTSCTPRTPQSNVLVYVPTSETYVLAAGRWFKAKSLDGPWTAVRPDQLPASFKQHPARLCRGRRAHLRPRHRRGPGRARRHADPADHRREARPAFQVTYDGEPRFKPIEGTQLAFAVNTESSVLQDAGPFWACHQAVWYVAPTPNGPWAVSDRRPPRLDQVPRARPSTTPSTSTCTSRRPRSCTSATLPGYVGVYPYYGTVVYGTGYYYPPYVSPVYSTRDRHLRLPRHLQPLDRIRRHRWVRDALLLGRDPLRWVRPRLPRSGLVWPGRLSPLPAALPGRLVSPSSRAIARPTPDTGLRPPATAAATGPAIRLRGPSAPRTATRPRPRPAEKQPLRSPRERRPQRQHPQAPADDRRPSR